jgi:hypothetical protein
MKPTVQERHITVGGEKCHVIAHQKTKTTWRAYGDFMGRSIEVSGARTANAAFDRWESRAQAMIFD